MRSRVEALSEILTRKSLSLSLAESCTGGMIGCAITSLPGSSSFFMGSAVAYSNSSKERLLGVNGSTIVGFGAVSEETASEMAVGSLKAFGSDVAAAVTGIAGPTGGSSDKPAGTVWMAITDGRRTVTFENHFDGDRNNIRKRSSEVLLDRILEFVG